MARHDAPHTARTTTDDSSLLPDSGNEFDRVRVHWARVWPELDTRALPLVARVMHLSRDVETFHELALRPHSLGHPEYAALSILRMQGEPYQLTPTELSRTLHQTTAGTSKTIDRLVGLGLVERTRHPRDKRRTLVGLTDEGVRVAEAAVESEARARAHLVRALGDDTDVLKALDALIGAFGAANRALGADTGFPPHPG
ncbi:MarR family winged helix-turn-helix transcriptional regulator [Yinghuangia sp. YIM S09857]|uniref:MarR family winged helix-turn-helix transcriptional regulator n=1 Tax=Yinghuangia sp. YIM S09857 TaxID=3436929 RepID=UPI003F53BD98